MELALMILLGFVLGVLFVSVVYAWGWVRKDREEAVTEEEPDSEPAPKPEEKPEPLRIWLDDERPAPRGWVWVKTVNEAREALRTRGLRSITISLDNDLGEGEPDGYLLVDWLTGAYKRNFGLKAHRVNVHSENVVARRRMLEALFREGFNVTGKKAAEMYAEYGAPES